MRDGHIHSPYCPHGTKDAFEEYVERAIEIGLEEMTFTEHLPLPTGFKDPSPEDDSAMKIDKLNSYINDVKAIKEKYADKIKINVGLEVDYIEGYEEYTRDILNEVGEELDDAILSVHIIKVDDEYHCVDYNPEEFIKLAHRLGGIDNLYSKYYQSVKKAINSDLGKFKPKRIGHLNLVRKFNQVHPHDYSKNKDLLELIKLIKDENYEVDYNISGLRKNDCKEPYLHGDLLDLIKEHDIPMVFGTDSHCADEILCLRDFSSKVIR